MAQMKTESANSMFIISRNQDETKILHVLILE
jgi:hypothetical protein